MILLYRLSLSRFSKAIRFLIAVFCFLAGYALVYFCLINSVNNHIHELKAELNAHQEQIRIKHQSVNALSLKFAADLSLITQKKSKTHDISLDLEDNYFALMGLLQNLNRQHAFFVIQSFHIQEADKFKLQLKLQARYYEGIGRPGRIIYPVIDPFYPYAQSQIKGGILSYPLNELKLSGTIQVNKQFIAIITTPEGQSYPLKLGSTLGLEHARLISIQNRFIKIVKPDHQLVTKELMGT